MMQGKEPKRSSAALRWVPQPSRPRWLRNPAPACGKIAGMEEAGETGSGTRRRLLSFWEVRNAAIEQAGPAGKPFGRVRRREILRVE